MGELLGGGPVAVKAAIVGVEGSDHVIEVIEYPHHRLAGPRDEARDGARDDLPT